MTSASVSQTPVSIDACNGHCKKEAFRLDSVEDHSVQLVQQLVETLLAHQRYGFHVNSVGNQRRRDAVSGNITHQQVEMMIPWRNQPEVAANGMRRLIRRLHHKRFPNHWLRH